jgi:hypothetical protein
MVSAIWYAALWLGIVLFVGCAIMAITNVRVAISIADGMLDGLQGVGERVSVAWTQARSWNRRRRYVGQHRAPSFTVTAPVMADA